MAINNSYFSNMDVGVDIGRISRNSIRGVGNNTPEQNQAPLSKERPNIERGNKVNINGRTYDRTAPRGTYLDISA